MAASTTSQPNVLLIVVDDLGVGDLHSFTPSVQTQTPTIDALAARGMRFSRFYTDSTCSASRASLLTGQSPTRLGFHPIARGISPEIITLPEWLRDMGYSTHLVGKWHIGELNTDALPAAQGFDSFFGYLNQWFLQGLDQDGKPVMRAPVYENPWLQDEKNAWQQHAGYLPDILTQRAVNDIAVLAKTDRPWLMWYATPLPHGPLHAPPEEKANNLSDDEKYRAMLRHLDRNVGELLAALHKTDQQDNTIVIFLSDNGAPEKRGGSNAGFVGGKAHYSEGAVRTPMFWVDPKVMPNSLDERAITIADVFPTLAARLGKPLPFTTDGVDFNAFENIKKIIDRPLYWMTRSSSSVLSADKHWRTTQEWTFRLLEKFQLWRIDAKSSQDETAQKILHFREIGKMQHQFVAWLNEVSRTPISVEKMPNGSEKLSGSDFLRTPLREWDFYIAGSASANMTSEQVLAEQAGVWSLRYSPEKKNLVVDMYGHHWAVPLDLSTSCTLIGLNADLYDRYTNLGQAINPTELLLSINGKELARTEWQTDSLAGVNVSEPTWVGISAAQKNRWQGKLSAAVFFHRANIVGEWPYFVDEAKLKEELCAQLQ
ncbi:MAG TPA: sulfatase-like hydrolase/transferase [Pseudomonadales bacterium]|nr:sulfatase-like hydrolase/transferase [Pseudomonadales bacterium]HRG49760.1 sulfatase-like hydrolase/transferase [Pseudomonadales bacterium]